MPEQLVLSFKADKDGTLSLVDMEGKVRKVQKATDDASISFSDMSAALQATTLVTGLNQGLQLLTALTGQAVALGEAMAHVDDVIGTQKWSGQIALAQGMLKSDLDAAMKAAVGSEMSTEQLDEIVARFETIGVSASSMATLVSGAFAKENTEGRKFEATLKAVEMAIGGGKEGGLRKAGIYVDFTRAYAEAAREAGVPVAALPEEQKRLAREMEVVAKMQAYQTPSVDGLGSAYDRLSASASDAKTAMLAALSGVAGWQEVPELTAVFGLGTVEDQVAALPGAMDAVRSRIALLREEADTLRGDITVTGDHVVQSGDMMAAELEARARSLQDAISAAASIISGKFEGIATEALAAAEAIGKQTPAAIASMGAVGDLADKMEGTQRRLNSLADLVADMSQSTPLFATALGDLADKLTTAARATGLQETRLRALDGAADVTDQTYRQWLGTINQLLPRMRFLDDAGKRLLAQTQEKVKAYDEANASQLAVAKSMSSLVSLTKELEAARSLLPAGSPEQIGSVADAMERVKETQSDLAKSIESGDVYAQGRAYAQAEAALSEYTGALRNAGLASVDVDKATADMTYSMSLLRTQVTLGRDAFLELGTASKAALDAMGKAMDVRLPGPSDFAKMEEWSKAQKRKGGNGGKTQDISADELAIRQELAKATDELTRIELEHTLAIQRLDEQRRKGTIGARAYSAAIAEEVAALDRSMMAARKAAREREAEARAKVMAFLPQAEVAGSAQAILGYVDAADRLYAAQMRLAVAQGKLTREQADAQSFDRAFWGSSDEEAQILLLDQTAKSLEDGALSWAEYGQAIAEAAGQMQGMMGWMEQIDSMNGIGSTFSDQTRIAAQQIGQIGAGLGKVVGSLGKGQDAIAEAAISASGAVGQMWASYSSKDSKEAAQRMAIFSGAQAALFAAFGLWPAAVSAGFAALEFGWLAGQAGGSRSVARSLGTAAATPASAQGGITNIFNISGEFWGSAEEAGDRVAHALTAATRGGSNLGLLPAGTMRRA